MARNDAPITIVQFDERTASSLRLSVEKNDPVALDMAREGGLHALAEQTPLVDGPCYTIFPRHDATLRILTLPTQNSDEIASMVSLSASEWVPYPIEEMLVTHQRLAVLSSGESRVLVVLIRHAALNAHLDALKAVGCEPTQIYLSTACLAAAAATMEATGDIALLHVDPAALELVVLQDGELRFSRGIAQNTPWNLDDAQSREILRYEVRDMLAAYRRESEEGLGAKTIQISVTGLPPTDLIQLLTESTEKDYRIADTGLILSPGGRAMPATFAGAARLIRGEGPLDIPLAPKSLAQERSMRTLQGQLLRSAALLGILLFSLLLWFGQAVWQRKALISELQKQIDIVAPSAQGVAAKQHSLQLIARQVDRGGSFLEILAGIAASAPPEGLNITRIQFERESGLSLWGRARTKDLVLKDFLGAMRDHAEGNLALFAQAHSLYETASVERGQTVFDYQISIPLPEEESDVKTSIHR